MIYIFAGAATVRIRRRTPSLPLQPLLRPGTICRAKRSCSATVGAHDGFQRAQVIPGTGVLDPGEQPRSLVHSGPLRGDLAAVHLGVWVQRPARRLGVALEPLLDADQGAGEVGFRRERGTRAKPSVAVATDILKA